MCASAPWGRFAYAITLLFAFFVAPSPPHVRAAEPVIPDYVHRAWTVEHGLPQNLVARLLASRDGSIWIGATNGIVRFDGLVFTVFDLTNTPALTSNRVGAFHESDDGTLWIATTAGIVRYREGRFTREDGEGRFADESFSALRPGPDGRLLAAGADRVYRRDANGYWRILPVEGVSRGIMALAVDRRGSLWIAFGRHLIEWRDRTLRTFTVRDGLPGAPIAALAIQPDGRIWIGTNDGLAQLDPDTRTVTTEAGSLARMVVKALMVDRDGVLWIGGNGQLTTRTPDGQVATYVVAQPMNESAVVALTQDVAGQIWYGVGGGPGGLHRLSRRRITTYTAAHGLPCDNISPVAAGSDGTIWLGTLCTGHGRGLVALKDGRLRTYAREANAPAYVSALLPEPDGELSIGTMGGEIVRFVNGRFVPITPPLPLGLTAIQALHRDEDGALWVAMEAGLARHRDGRWRIWREKDGLASNNVRTIISGPDRSLWIGTDRGITRYEHGRFVSYRKAEGIPGGEVRALHVDRDGVLWIGAYGGGLARWKDGRVTSYGTLGGLLDASVHRIIEDDRGYFWLSGDRGIRRVSRRDLTAIAHGQQGPPRVEIFDTADGMINAECNGMGQPAGARGGDGVLWFPSQGGLARLDPSTIGGEAPAPVSAIESVRVNGIDQPDLRAIKIPPGARDIEIRYAAPAPMRAEQIHFRYRLFGHDDSWVDAGPRRIAHFANLEPGAYRFEVAARSHAGEWSDRGASLVLVLQPRLHQRLAFKVSVAGGLLLALVFGVRLRLRRLARRAEALDALVAERTTELHAEREDLKAAKTALEASHTDLLATFDQLRVGVILVDLHARVRFLSDATRPLVGDEPLVGLIGQPLERVLPIAQDALAAILAQIRHPQPGVRVTGELLPASGERFWAEIEVHPHHHDPNQRVLHLYDVTETFDLKRVLQTGPRAVGAELLGESVGICDLRHEIARIADVDATVLIEGETGTGKELVARAIHAASRRKDRPFVAVNCAGLTESLLASQLFGHRRGAFTGAVSDHVGLFEAANGGTLLLDEIGDMPIGVQTHLLRVLEDRTILRVGDSKPRPIDVRVLAATHRTLEADVTSGRFREDLLYRIRVVRLHVPPLRLRADDIPLLAAAFLRAARERHGLRADHISREAMDHLRAYRWPGNVRQLKATIEGAAIRAAGPILKPTDILAELPQERVTPSARSLVSDRERDQLLDALSRTHGNRSAAARLLGWPRSTFYHRLSRLETQGVHIPPDPSRD